jgi:hypothetical protein
LLAVAGRRRARVDKPQAVAGTGRRRHGQAFAQVAGAAVENGTHRLQGKKFSDTFLLGFLRTCSSDTISGFLESKV